MKAYDFHGKRNICGDRIREARLRARLSQSDLCRRLQLAGGQMSIGKCNKTKKYF